MPAVYRRDAASWEQIQAYFRPFNTLCRQFALSIHDLPAWLSPAAPEVNPPGSWIASNADVLTRQSEVLDEVASWFDFEFEPVSLWTLGERSGEAAWLESARGIVRDKSRTLRALPRLMRGRATPPGLLELFCAAFRLRPDSEDECPLLFEHWANRPTLLHAGGGGVEAEPANDQADDEDPRGPAIRCDVGRSQARDDGYAWRASLLLPPVPIFSSWDRLSEAEDWIERNSPAHAWIDVHPVTPTGWKSLVHEALPAGLSDIHEILAMVERSVPEHEAMAPGQDELNLGRVLGDLPNAEER